MRNILLILLLIISGLPLLAQSPVLLKLDTIELDCNAPDTFFVPMRVANFDTVGSFQFSINWDTTYLDFTNIASVNPIFNSGGGMIAFNILPQQTSQGRLSAVWTSGFGGTSAPDDTQVFTVGFVRKGGPFTPVKFGTSPSGIEVTNEFGFEVPWDTIHGGVQPLDTLPPFVGCPDDVTVQASGPTPVPNIAPDSLSDNCEIFNVGWSSTGATVDDQPNDPDASGAIFEAGVSTVTYTAVDIVAQTDTCSFNVTVEVVNIDPVFEIEDASGSCGQQVVIPVTTQNFDSLYSASFSVMWPNAELGFDSVGGFLPALMLGPGNFDQSQLGTGALGFSWITGDSLTGTSVANGSVLFNLYFTLLGNDGTNSAVTFTNTPNSQQIESSAVLPPMIVSATYIPGNATVVDNVPPVIECPASVTVDAPMGSITAQVMGLEPVTLTDDCGGTPALSYQQSGATNGSGSGDANGLYIAVNTLVVYTATDSAGNTSTCSFNVTVNADLPLVYTLDSIDVDCGSTQVEFNVTVENFIDIIGSNFSITWDETVLGFDTVYNDYPGLNLTPSDFLGFASTPNGVLQFLAGNSISGWPMIPNDSIFFTIVFDVLGPTNGIPISFSPPIDAVNSSFNSVPVITNNGFFALSGLDTIPPTIECPASVTVDAPQGSTMAQVNGLEPVQLSDDCSIPELTFLQTGATLGAGTGPANGVYNAGETVVVYTATDGSGQTSTCSFTVNVEANVLTVRLDSVFIDCDSAIQQVQVNVSVENFEDIIGLQFSVEWDPAILQFDTVDNDFPGLNLTPADFLGFASTPAGVLRFLAGNAVSGWPMIPDDGIFFTITFNILDPNALSGLTFLPPFDAVNSSFMTVPLLTVDGSFEIVDSTPPVFDPCPDPIAVQAPNGSCQATVFVPQPMAMDACSGIDSITPTMTDTIYPVGNSIVTFVAVDSSGNSAECLVLVNVTEDVPPVFISCPDSIEVVLSADTCTQAIDWQVPLFNDNCSVDDVVLTSTHMPGDTFTVGTTNVVYTATDFSGNTAVCSFAITLRDTISPGIICPADLVVDANPDLGCAQIVFFGPAFATDNCDTLPSVVGSVMSGDTLPAGINEVVFTATDISGNTSTCTFNITVVDSVAPVLTCPDDLFLPVDSMLDCAAIADFDLPQFSDACDPNPTLMGDIMPGDTLPTGTTVGTYTVSDGSGNTTTCNFTVTVTDANAPVLTCPDNIVTDVDTGTCGAIVTWDLPEVMDDCDTMPNVSSVFMPGQLFVVGTTVVTYTAQDISGNIGTCSFTITVNEDEAPVFPNGCPDDIEVFLNASCDTIISFQAPDVSDNCGVDTLFSTPASGSVFLTGSTEVVYSVVDNAGNTTTCSFNVVVRDLVDPVIDNCPPTLNVTLEPGDCDTVLSWATPMATDNCLLDTVLSIPEPGGVFGPGSYTVTFFALDASGNDDTCSFNIVVLTDQVPGFINFPGDETVVLDSVNCDTVLFWDEPLLVGTCDTIPLTSNFEPGDTFSTGETWVVYEGFDFDGSPIRDSFLITVIDPVAPVFRPCPEGPIVVNTAGVIISDPDNFIAAIDPVNNCLGATIEYGFPEATDNCGVPNVDQTGGPLSGSTFEARLDTLTFIATDISGNTAACVVALEIQTLDQVDPTVNPNPGCPGSSVTLSAPEFSGAVYTWTGPQQVYPDTSSITINNLNTSLTGTYTLQIEVNGCISQVDTVEVLMASAPMAEDDNNINVDPGMVSDTFNVLDNDIISVGGVTVEVLDEVDGLMYLGDGNFIYEAGEVPGEVNFLYNVCSEACPDLCDMASVTIIINQNDCGEIPNVITPNGDDVNDYLVIPCLETGRFENNSIIIYNQWGDKVFEASPYSNDPINAWRGELDGESGKDLPDGTYFYIFNPGPNEKLVNGFIEIYR